MNGQAIPAPIAPSGDSIQHDAAAEAAHAAVQAALKELFKEVKKVVDECRGKWHLLEKAIKERKPLGAELLYKFQGKMDGFLELLFSDQCTSSLSSLNEATRDIVNKVDAGITEANSSLRDIIDVYLAGRDVAGKLKELDDFLGHLSRYVREAIPEVLQDRKRPTTSPDHGPPPKQPRLDTHVQSELLLHDAMERTGGDEVIQKKEQENAQKSSEVSNQLQVAVYRKYLFSPITRVEMEPTLKRALKATDQIPPRFVNNAGVENGSYCARGGSDGNREIDRKRPATGLDHGSALKLPKRVTQVGEALVLHDALARTGGDEVIEEREQKNTQKSSEVPNQLQVDVYRKYPFSSITQVEMEPILKRVFKATDRLPPHILNDSREESRIRFENLSNLKMMELEREVAITRGGSDGPRTSLELTEQAVGVDGYTIGDYSEQIKILEDDSIVPNTPAMEDMDELVAPRNLSGQATENNAGKDSNREVITDIGTSDSEVEGQSDADVEKEEDEEEEEEEEEEEKMEEEEKQGKNRNEGSVAGGSDRLKSFENLSNLGMMERERGVAIRRGGSDGPRTSLGLTEQAVRVDSVPDRGYFEQIDTPGDDPFVANSPTGFIEEMDELVNPRDLSGQATDATTQLLDHGIRRKIPSVPRNHAPIEGGESSGEEDMESGEKSGEEDKESVLSEEPLGPHQSVQPYGGDEVRRPYSPNGIEDIHYIDEVPGFEDMEGMALQDTPLAPIEDRWLADEMAPKLNADVIDEQIERGVEDPDESDMSDGSSNEPSTSDGRTSKNKRRSNGNVGPMIAKLRANFEKNAKDNVSRESLKGSPLAVALYITTRADTRAAERSSQARINEDHEETIPASYEETKDLQQRSVEDPEELIPPTKARKSGEKSARKDQKVDRKYCAKAFVVAVEFRDKDKITKKCPALQKLAEDIKEQFADPCEVPLDKQYPVEKNNYRGIIGELTRVLVPPRAVKRPGDRKGRQLSLEHHPRVAYCTIPYVDYLTVKGGEIIANARQGPGHACSSVVQKEKLFYLCIARNGKKDKKDKPESDKNDVIDKERRWMADCSAGNGEICLKAGNFVPGVLCRVETTSAEENERILDLMQSAPSFLLENLLSACNIAESSFQMEKIFTLGAKLDTVVVIRDLPQRTETNFSYNQSEDDDKWISGSYQQTIKFQEFKDHYNLIVELSTKARQDIAENPEQVESILEKLQQDLDKNVVPFDQVLHSDSNNSRKPSTYLPLFCTNLSLSREMFGELYQLIDRLPEILRPNNGRDMLNNLNIEMGGINTPQMFLRFPSSRSALQGESGFFSSVNWNFGPGDNVWYMVPMEHIGDFWKHMEENKDLKKEVIQDFAYWPLPDELIAANIPVQKVVQKPGQMVIVGMGTLSWVQSIGFTSNVSWNVALPGFTQLACAVLDHDRLVSIKKIPIVPLEPLVWKWAMDKKELDVETRKLVKWMLMKSLEKCQMEVNWVAAKRDSENIEIIEESPYLYSVESCSSCGRILFNCVVRDEEDSSLCLECYHKALKKTRDQQNEQEMPDEHDEEQENVEEENVEEKSDDLEKDERAEMGKEEDDEDSTDIFEKSSRVETVEEENEDMHHEKMNRKGKRSKKSLSQFTVHFRHLMNVLSKEFDDYTVVP